MVFAMQLKDLLDDLNIREINRLPAHFTARRSARTAFPETLLSEITDYSFSLNGIWSIHWSPDLEHRAEGFQDPAFDVSAWQTISLPATFEMQGYGTPIYRNCGWTFSINPPLVSDPPPEHYTSFTERNSTASCRRTFVLPEEWSGEKIILHFGGVQSAFRVWINGVFAGYGEDSASVSEFDITSLVKSANAVNTIAVQVYKYCAGSYLEDQDCWRFSGIFRDIELFALDPRHIADAFIVADPEKRCVSAKVELSCSDDDTTLELICGGSTTGEMHARDLILPFPDFEYWSAERPVLYPATLILRDNGRICDIRHFRVGFRSICIRDRQLFLNGVSIKLKGVNRHEIHPASGRVICRADMERDIRMIKDANFNAVRNSHYPQAPVWYELCDLYGLYVMDEANVESHGLSYHVCVLPGDDPAWETPVLERLRRMVLQNRNHPGILIWSMGNEAGFGNAFEKGRSMIRQLDERPVHYADMNSQADFDSRTYPSCGWLLDYVAGTAEFFGERGEAELPRQSTPKPSQKPFIANEYAHTMACSGGNVADWWQIVEQNPCLIGGFVWEWCEHALDRDGIPSSAYGGDFGDVPNNGCFCCDGLVSSDRRAFPTYYQLRAVQKPFDLFLAEDQTLCIRNKYYFTDLKERIIKWSLVTDGVISAEGELVIGLPPGGSAPLPVTAAIPADASSVYWRVALLENGVSMGEGEVCVRDPLPVVPQMEKNPCSGADLPGLLEQPRLVFDRVWTDNDLAWKLNILTMESLKTAAYRLDLFRHTEHGFRAEVDYTGGEVARIGIRLIFRRNAIRSVRWYGAGPLPTYADRRELALHGWWEEKAENLFIRHTRPMENGHRSDVRELILISDEGQEIRICADTLFGFNLYGVRSETLLQCKHDFELPQQDLWELTLDLAMCGVGADNSWGAEVYPRYRLQAGAYHGNFFFQIR